MILCHLIRRMTLVIISLLLCATSAIVYAEPVATTPIDPEIIDKIVSRRSGNDDPLPQGIVKALTETLDMMSGFDAAQPASATTRVAKAHRATASDETQNMLLAAKLAEFSVLRNEVRQRISAYRSRFSEMGLAEKTNEWDRRAQLVEQKFDELTQTLEAIRSAQKPQARAQAAQQAKQTLEKLMAPQVIHPVDLPGSKPTLRQEKIQPPSELPVSQTLPRYMQDP